MVRQGLASAALRKNKSELLFSPSLAEVEQLPVKIQIKQNEP